MLFSNIITPYKPLKLARLLVALSVFSLASGCINIKKPKAGQGVVLASITFSQADQCQIIYWLENDYEEDEKSSDIDSVYIHIRKDQLSRYYERISSNDAFNKDALKKQDANPRQYLIYKALDAGDYIAYDFKKDFKKSFYPPRTSYSINNIKSPRFNFSVTADETTYIGAFDIRYEQACESGYITLTNNSQVDLTAIRELLGARLPENINVKIAEISND